MNYYFIEDAQQMQETIAGSCYRDETNNIWDKRPKWDFSDKGIAFYNSLQYPLGLLYVEPWDAHCCGTYYRVEIAEALEHLIHFHETQAIRHSILTNKYKKYLDKSENL